ncbi:hypothetical protein C8J57DRAFT_1433504 [Mycena rebaudengoi]|nr:hypothetical protein C8J57DRAFT_1433504 [Mycena rebaudengoi]
MLSYPRPVISGLGFQADSPRPCPQVEPLFPILHAALLARLDETYKNARFKSIVYEKLGGAIRIPTESYDGMKPVGQDSRWGVFQDYHKYLERSFPTIYTSLQVNTVNTYGLVLTFPHPVSAALRLMQHQVFHWQGSDTSLKPTLLAAHQGRGSFEMSCPLIQTLDQWIHDPYSGKYDGWNLDLGRGSADEKSDMIALLTSIESLLGQKFKPRRTIVLAFGIDEESAGTEGAGKIAEYLEKTYGKDSFSFLLGLASSKTIHFSSFYCSDRWKGYSDVRIEVYTLGGHSSVPPEHTSIGILSRIIVALEHRPHATSFLRSGTAFANAQCAIFKVILASVPLFETMLRTTQAVDIVSGGVKANALPEQASALVNHRIAEHASVADVQEHMRSVISPIASELNITLYAFPAEDQTMDNPRIVLTDPFSTALEPSPVTPIEGRPYEFLSGTIKAALETADRYNSTGIIISPSLGLDSRFYWNLTSHIFRYSHYGDTDDYYNGLHTVNEAVKAEAVVEHIRFYTTLILNSDETTLF